MESTKSKENKSKKENKKGKETKESKSKMKKKTKKSKKDKKSKVDKKDKERKTKSELEDPNEAMFLNKKIKLLEEQLKDKTNNFNNNNLNNNNLDNNLYNINNFNISLKNSIHILNYHKNWILFLSILNDGRLISGSADNSIIIYNKITYQTDLMIEEHKDSVNCIIQLSSGILATCSKDKTIKLFNIKRNNYNIIQTLNDHTDWIYKIIEIENKYLVSCSNDESIIFYLR